MGSRSVFDSKHKVTQMSPNTEIKQRSTGKSRHLTHREVREGRNTACECVLQKRLELNSNPTDTERAPACFVSTFAGENQ